MKIGDFVIRYLSLLLAVLASASLAAPAFAQTATVDWTNLGIGNLQAVPSGATLNASDGTNVTIVHTTDINGQPFAPVFDNSHVVSYDPFFGGQSGPLIFNFNNVSYDPLDRVVGTVTLARAVRNLRFTIVDVDADNGSFGDAVTVEYDTGNGNWVNAGSGFNPPVWTAGPAVARRNNGTVNGWVGTANAGGNDTTANIAFDFGNTAVRRIRIRFHSNSGTGDPDNQFMGLSDLSFTAQDADLSLTKTALNSAPTSGSSATFRLTVNNAAASALTANGIIVRDILPSGFSFTGSTGTGNYNPANGLWSVGSLAPGQRATLDIIGTVSGSGGALLTNTAEITVSSAPDSDSVPNNGRTDEDDFASATMTVGSGGTAGVPPTLTCPRGNILHDWNVRNWAAGTINNSYPLGTVGTIGFSMVNPGTWLNNAGFGGQSPVGTNIVTGGLGAAEVSVVQLVDLASRNDVVTTTVALPAKMQGAQFRIIDVDSSPNQFADRVRVIGRLNGTTVTPVLTNGSANYVIGNEAFGNGSSANTESNGNVVVTFSQPIDTVVIDYGNHSAAPDNPGQQAISLHDMTFCLPTTTISSTKTSAVMSDPVNNTNNPKAIPGAIIEYCITIANTGISPATAIAIADNLPTNVTYIANSMTSGTTCANATTAEDDNSTGADESDPVGANFTNGTVTATAPTFAAGATLAFKLRATVD